MHLFCVNTMILKDICVDEVPSYHIAGNFGSNYIWQKCTTNYIIKLYVGWFNIGDVMIKWGAYMSL